MKRLTIPLLIGCLCVLFSVSVLALNNVPGARVVDAASLLEDYERQALVQRLDEISQEYSCDIVVVTASSCGSKTPREYADDFYDQNGYGYGPNRDGLLFLVSMEERDWYFSATGSGSEWFDDGTLEKIGQTVRPYLSSASYAKAFDKFASMAEKQLQGEEDKQRTPVKIIVASCMVGLAAALIVTLVLRRKMKTVRKQQSARDYVRSGGVTLTRANEIYLYRTVTRTARPKDSGGRSFGGSGHVSSSGTRHTGRGGKF